MQQNRYWVLNRTKNDYVESQEEPLSVFPTIVNMQQKVAYCRSCHRWEYIVGFKDNLLRTQCGRLYEGPFAVENSIINYGYLLKHKGNIYDVIIRSQTVVTTNRRVFDTEYAVDLNQKKLFRNNKAVFESEDLGLSLCHGITDVIMNDLAEQYKTEYGIKPTITSQLKGFNLIIGYMLCPFNINFFKISKHWGLNPYDKFFTSLSSGNSPSAENEMFENLNIKPTKTVRKMYEKSPYTIVCYAAAADLGFTDVNILQKSAGAQFYAFLSSLMITLGGGTVNYMGKDGLSKFVKDMLEITHNNQKSVWNSIEKTIKYFLQDSANKNITIDAFNIYSGCRDNLSDSEKKEVMKEGFNNYTHNFLLRRGGASGTNGSDPNQVINFDIEQKFLDLEYKTGENYVKVPGSQEYRKVEDDERYCFYVARSSSILQVVGNEMHNCVGYGYAESVKNRRCTIVYAKYKKHYRICIEVTPQFGIRQALGPCNQVLEGEDLNAYQEWCQANNIQFSRIFSPKVAP